MMSIEAFRHYRTGISEIDDQHFAIFTLLNDINAAIKNRDKNSAQTLFDKFKIDLNIHCKYEENLMLKSNYKYYETHKRYHPESTEQLLTHITKNRDILYLDTNKMMILLRDHIDYADLQFAEYYKNIMEPNEKF